MFDDDVVEEDGADVEGTAEEEEADAEPEEPKCETCNGRGFVDGADAQGFPSPRAQSMSCPACGGSGKPKVRAAPTDVETSIRSTRKPGPEPEPAEEALDPQVPPEEGAAVASAPTEEEEPEEEDEPEEE